MSNLIGFVIRKYNGSNNSLFLSCQMGLSDGAFFMIKHTPLPNGNHPILSPVCPMGVADTLEQWFIHSFMSYYSKHEYPSEGIWVENRLKLIFSYQFYCVPCKYLKSNLKVPEPYCSLSIGLIPTVIIIFFCYTLINNRPTALE